MCIRGSGDKLSCFGRNTRHETALDLDPATVVSSPRAVVPPPSAGAPASYLSLASGFAHSCNRFADGTLCFGDNTLGQLGDASAMSVVTKLPPFALVAAGAFTTFAVVRDPAGEADDVIVAWGANILGLLGHSPGLASSGDTFANLWKNATRSEVSFPKP